MNKLFWFLDLDFGTICLYLFFQLSLLCYFISTQGLPFQIACPPKAVSLYVVSRLNLCDGLSLRLGCGAPKVGTWCIRHRRVRSYLLQL